MQLAPYVQACRSFFGILLIACLILPSPVCGAPGDVDPSFDPGLGPRNIQPGEGNSPLIQPDGKIIVGGNFNGVNTREVPPVVRFHPDGSLDETFDASALTPAQFSLSGQTELVPLALQPNGQVLVAPGRFNTSYGTRALLRLNADGSLDAAFAPVIEDDYSPEVSRAAVLSDGRILISGGFDSINGTARPGLARLNPDGTLDFTFNPARVGHFRLAPNGQVIVGSDTLYRLNANGSLDPSFSSNIAAPNGQSGLGEFVVQPDGKVIFSVSYDFYGSSVVRRLNANGSNDASFEPFYGQFASVLLLQSDGKVIVSGARLHPNGTPDESFDPRNAGPSFDQQSDGKLITAGQFYSAPFGLRRLFLDGSLDQSFAVNRGLTSIARSKIERAALLPDGRIAVAGRFNYFGPAARNSVAILRPDGRPDESFDSGDLILPSASGDLFLGGLVAQPDSKILIAVRGELLRLKPDGGLDSTFNYVPVQPNSPYVTGVILQPDGKILLRGADGLVRLMPDGSNDSAFHPAENGEALFVEPDGKIMLATTRPLATRLNADGSLDAGLSSIGGAPTFDYITAMTRQPDGKYLVTRTDIANFSRNVFFRLNYDGSRDPTFENPNLQRFLLIDNDGIIGANSTVNRYHSDGTSDSGFRPVEFNAGSTLSSVLQQSDSRVLVAGLFNRVNGVVRHGIARILTRPAPEQLANVSTRARVESEEGVAIGGFIITGDQPKKVIVRALGSSLQQNGLAASETLANPSLELHGAGGALIATNDNWRDSQAGEITGSSLIPTGDLESAIVATLQPGAYTAVVRGSDGGHGLSLVEVYDLDPNAAPRLANISTRARVSSGDGVMIGGFIVGGSGPSTVVVRALGPSLASYGLQQALADPSLTLYNQTGTALGSNNDWRQGEPARIESYGLGGLADRESALVATVPPGPYTAIVREAAEETGVALVEVYRVE